MTDAVKCIPAAGRRRRHRRFASAPRRQRGALAVTGAIFLVVAVSLLLGVTYLGQYFAAHRQLQAAADLAALSAVQEINADPTCSGTALSVAQGVLQANGYTADAANPPVIQCGYWQAGNVIGGAFSQAVPSGQQANAVSVALSSSVAYFGGTETVHAVARNVVQDTFSLSSTLATLNGGLVNSLLNGLLSGIFGGQQFNLGLSIGDYQNLLGVNLNLLGITAALGVGSVDDALNLNLSVGQLIQAEITAASQQGIADVNLNVLNAIKAALPLNGGPSIQLGNLIGLSLANGSSAADVNVNAFSLLTTALETAYVSANGITVSNGSNFIQIPLSINIPSNPLLSANVSLYVSLLQPPTIASGPPGTNANGQYYTFAQSAVAKVFLTVQLSVLNLGFGSALNVNLPIWLFVGPSTAGLTSVNCTAAARSATIDVSPGVLGLYIGGSMSSPPNFNAGTGVATSTSPAQPIISVLNLIPGLPALLSISIGETNGLALPLGNPGSELTFNYPMNQDPSTWSANANSNPPYGLSTSTNLINGAGDLIQTVLAELSNPANLTISVLGVPLTILSDIVSILSPIITGVLSPVLALLDAIVTPLLQLLGLQVGVATVQNFPSAIACGPSLVR